MSTERHEIVIIGAGIAGASLAYFLSEQGMRDVLVVERETQPAFHASGRSASTLVELDANPTIQQLKMQGARFLQNPPAGFSEQPLLKRCGVLLLLSEPEWALLEQMVPVLDQAGTRVERLMPAQASARVGGLLNETEFAGAAFLPEDGIIDVHQLLWSYIGRAKRQGLQFRMRCEVSAVIVEGGRCQGVQTAAGRISSRCVVNAAGAWVARIAASAAARAIPLVPYRRSIVLFAPPAGLKVSRWPLVWSDRQRLYFRPDPAGILFCPMDEEPMDPCDPRPDDLVFAEGLERLALLAPGLLPSTLGWRWAGLRTFSPDRVPVVGEDPCLPGFFWLAGQGGCGIETSAALGRLAADLIVHGCSERFDEQLLTPGRFPG